MSKWRNTCPDALLTRISQGYEAQLYLLRQTGPTGFLVKEHDNETKFKVLLGATHSCDCSLYLKEKELCKHIIWILTRKFRLEKESPLVYQLGLNERELNNVIYVSKEYTKKEVIKVCSAGNGKDVAEKKKEIESDDVCPICQEDIYKTKKTLIHCKFGCGNSIHVNCMKIWADHQLKSLNEEIIKCPLCRTEFSSHRDIVKEYALAKSKEKGRLQQQRHFCNSCNSRVVIGQYYRCSVCKNVYLCSKCFLGNYHDEHSFEFRQSANEKWSTVSSRHGISLTPSVSRFNKMRTNEVLATSQQRSNSMFKSNATDRVRSRLVKSAHHVTSLPDLSLGVTGMNLQVDEKSLHCNTRVEEKHNRNIHNKPRAFRLPPLLNHNGQSTGLQNRSAESMSGQQRRVKIKKFALKKKEHSLPIEGITDVFSVSPIRQRPTDSM